MNLNHIDPYSTVSRRGGVVATVIYIVVIGCAMWLGRCESAPPTDEELEAGSILIAFGDSPDGGGEELQQSEPVPEPVSAPAPKPTPKATPEPTPTDERSDVEQVQPEPKESVEPVVPPREVDKTKLFPGAKKSGDKSRGSKEGDSVEGSKDGSAESSSLLGGGLSGSFNLAGRALREKLPHPGYNLQEQGRVVMNIIVDESGRVVAASVEPTTSTTNNSVLIKAAHDAAMKARFTPSDAFNQRGTITYTFTLKAN